MTTIHPSRSTEGTEAGGAKAEFHRARQESQPSRARGGLVAWLLGWSPIQGNCSVPLCASLCVLCATALGGCTHIPPGSVDEYHRTTNILGVTSQTDLTDIRVTGKTVRAGTGTFVLSFPGVTHTQTVKGLILSNPNVDTK